MPKVFGNFRSSTTITTTTVVPSTSKQQPVPNELIKKSTSYSGDNKSSSSSNNGWARHYNSSTSNDYLNNTDDTEESSQSALIAPNDPIITESSYVYPTTTTATSSTASTTGDYTNPNQPIDSGKLYSSRNVSNSDAASTKAVKPVTELLWESAEPFITYSSAQGAKWCNIDHLSSVFEESCIGKNRNGGGRQNQDYDDTLAIVGTQDDEDDDGATNNNATFTPFTNMGMSNLCGSAEGRTVPNLISWTTTIPQLVVPCGHLQQVNDKELQSSGNSQEAPNSNNETDTTNNKNPSRRIVISRTHEDIEVSPGHHVQVRLPPTNPILKLASPARLNKVASISEARVVTTSTTNIKPRSSSDVVSPTELHVQRQIVKNSSNDSCKAVPHKPNDDVPNDKNDVVPNAEKKNHDDDDDDNDNNIVGATTTATAAGTAIVPVVSFEIKPEEALELERSISELTMRSSYAATDSTLQKIPENRRMAYYAVGKHHRQTGKGGNRRCYFSGKLILGGTPFYAGSVLQGLRTLVVFCLPSSVGLPDKESLVMLNLQPQRTPQQLLTSRSDSHSTGTNTLRGLRLLKSGTNGSGSKQSAPSYISHYTQHSNNLGAGASHTGSTIKSSSILSNRSNRSLQHQQQNQHRSSNNSNNFNSGASTAGSKSMMSRLSSLDDLSLSVEGDLDPNWSLDRDMLLKILPPANTDLLRAMSTLYAEQFETLPVQVRDAKQWKLYVKFCFFSGLPISDGEMHYKVRDDIAEQVYGEEIVLSHDVMEASTGASAEILSLPNRTVMRYLRKHYAQQCSKLDDSVFQRASWERVAPEV